MKIGITGGIGSGKTYVCNLIEKMGYPVFYSDKEAALLMNKNKALIKEIKTLIGTKAYFNNQINKTEIGTYIFKNKSNRTNLNQIVHPFVYDQFHIWSNQFSQKELIFNESAILFETGSYKRFDKTILITASLETRINRINERDNLTKEDTLKRINSQLTDEVKIKLVDYVIPNNENELLLPKINKVLDELKNISL